MKFIGSYSDIRFILNKKVSYALDGVRTRDLPLTKGTPYHLATKACFFFSHSYALEMP